MNATPDSTALGDRLRALPAAETPPCDWAELRQRAARCAHRAERAQSLRPALAACAAAVLLAVAGLAWWQRVEGPPPGTASTDPRFQARGMPQPFAGDTTAMEFAAATPLIRPALHAALVRVDTHAPVAALEDQIAWVDDALSIESIEGAPPARLAALEHERARLVDALVRVRHAETLSAMTR